MRKILFIILLVVFLLSFSGSVSAEGGLTSYNWSDVAGIIQGTFSDTSSYYLIEDVDAVIWLPSFFPSVDLTEEDIENGGVGSFIANSGDAFVYLSYSDLDGMTLESLFSFYNQNNYDVEKVLVNDIPAILVRDEANNFLSLSYQTQEGKVFQAMFYPALDENYAVLFNLVISSIRPYSPLVETQSEPVVSNNPVSGLISK